MVGEMFTITCALEHILWFPRHQFSAFSLPGHPSERGGVKMASLVVASCNEGCLLKSQLSGSSVLDTKRQIGTSLTTSVQNVLLSIFQETSVYNFCPENSNIASWVIPDHHKCQATRAHFKDSHAGEVSAVDCLASTVSQSLPVKGLRQARTIA